MKKRYEDMAGKDIDTRVVVEGLFYTVKDGLLLYLDKVEDQVFVNKSFCGMFGYECELLFREKAIGILPPDLLEQVQKDLPALFAREQHEHGSRVINLSNYEGKKITVRADQATVDSKDGRLIVLVLRDITWLQLLEKRKKQAESILRHDLRNYALAIERLAQSIKERSTDETIARLSKMLVARSESLVDLVDDDLRNFQIEEGLYTIKRENCNLNHILTSVVSQFEEIDESPNSALSYHHDDLEDGYNVYYVGDCLLLERMLYNLIKNAYESSSSEEKVDIEVREGKDEVSIRVKNSQPIPEELREEFLYEKVTTKEEGHGLGAYSARIIAESHGGSIDVATSGEVGTRITVRLPVEDKPGETPYTRP